MPVKVSYALALQVPAHLHQVYHPLFFPVNETDVDVQFHHPFVLYAWLFSAAAVKVSVVISLSLCSLCSDILKYCCDCCRCMDSSSIRYRMFSVKCLFQVFSSDAVSSPISSLYCVTSYQFSDHCSSRRSNVHLLLKICIIWDHVSRPRSSALTLLFIILRLCFIFSFFAASAFLACCAVFL